MKSKKIIKEAQIWQIRRISTYLDILEFSLFAIFLEPIRNKYLQFIHLPNFCPFNVTFHHLIIYKHIIYIYIYIYIYIIYLHFLERITVIKRFHAFLRFTSLKTNHIACAFYKIYLSYVSSTISHSISEELQFFKYNFLIAFHTLLIACRKFCS